MRSIERRFFHLQKKYPELSSLVNFGSAIKGQRFAASAIHRHFGNLVEKEDYASHDKLAVLRHLKSLNGTEDDKKSTQKGSATSVKVLT